MILIHFGKSKKCNAKNSTMEAMEIKSIIIPLSESTPLHVEKLRIEKEPAFSYFYRLQTKLRKGNVFYTCLQWRIQDFPEEGAATPQGGHQHTILPYFPENCMKLKELGPAVGARVPRPPLPLRSATGL